MYFYKHGVSARPLSGYMVNVCVACVLLKAKKTSLSESMLLMWAIVQMIAYLIVYDLGSDVWLLRYE